MVDLLQEDEIAELKAVFTEHDTNGDGCIAVTELGSLLRAMKFHVTEADVADFIADIDPDGYGLVDFCEVLSIIVRKIKSPEPESDLLEAFKVYDRDGNGFITAQELEEVLKKIGEPASKEEVDAIIQETDQDGDGQINYADFIRVMTEKPS